MVEKHVLLCLKLTCLISEFSVIYITDKDAVICIGELSVNFSKDADIFCFYDWVQNVDPLLCSFFPFSLPKSEYPAFTQIELE